MIEASTRLDARDSQSRNVIDEIQQHEVPAAPDYSEEERKYLGGSHVMLERDRGTRESNHDELDTVTYSQYWEANEKGGDTFVEPKKNREDPTFQSGTIERKLFAFRAETTVRVLAEATAFDRNDLNVRAIGNSVEDAITKGNELDGDEEKRTLRQYELLKQDDVFVEKISDEQYTKEKRFRGARFDGKVESVDIITRWKRKMAKPSTAIFF